VIAMPGNNILERIGGVTLQRDVGEAETKLRRELAAAFRIAHHLGWNKDTLNHITARVPDTETFLMNPVGLGWDEITASSLVTVDFARNVLSHSGIRLAPAGFNFHSGILKARSDIHSVIHVHESAGKVISAIGEGLMILNQGGCFLHGEVGYHDFEGQAKEEDEVPRILRDLGAGHTLIMTNHGLLSIGASVGEAFGWMRSLIEACALQERTMATGGRIMPIPEAIQRHTKAQLSGGTNTIREDHSWQYWLRFAERLAPDFAS
jgi:ribulose-5-phosphate 4-epimerase/fuculose-1-phosphate aldolase